MLCCLNPDCPSPLNPDGNVFCQSCSTRLITLLAGHYRVIKVLSNEGGFGRTYLAEDIHKLNERCVVKQLAPKVQGTWALNKAIELFQEEAKRLQELGEHHQIPTLLAYFEQDHNMYLVQQFIDGQNLIEELKTRGIYSEAEIRELLLDLLPVLKFIHKRRVIHRDIKPPNIIRRKSDSSLVLIDFGASKQLTATVHTKMGTTIGSHGYSPVEQIKDGEAYPASDLFSLGANCFHLLTGISPFHLWVDHGFGWVTNWRQYLKSDISAELGDVLDKLLKKDIEERYQSADEVIKDLTPQASPQPSIPPTQPVLTPIQPTLSSVPPTQPVANPIQPASPSIPAQVFVQHLKIVALAALRWYMSYLIVLVVSGLVGYWFVWRSSTTNQPAATPTATTPIGLLPTSLPNLPQTIGVQPVRSLDNLDNGWVLKTTQQTTFNITKDINIPPETFFKVIQKENDPQAPGKVLVHLQNCSTPRQALLLEPSQLARYKFAVLPADQPSPCDTPSPPQNSQ